MSDYLEPSPPVDAAVERAIAVQKKYESILLAIPSVIGVGVGSIHLDEDNTDEIGVIVMVDPSTRPLTGEVEQAISELPKRLDGVAVQVQEMGSFTAF